MSEESQTLESAAVKLEELGQEEDEEMLNGMEKTKFRSLAVTLNYMSLDRSDVQYAANETCTKMSNPTQGSWTRLTKAARFLKGVERVTWAMRAWEHDEMKVDVNMDSRRAKGPWRESTSGGMINGTVVKHWSRTRATRELRTAAAEYYAVVTGGSRNAVDDDGLGPRRSHQEEALGEPDMWKCNSCCCRI